FADVGWVAFNPLPDGNTPPRPLEDQFLPKPSPPTSPPASVEPPKPPTASVAPHTELAGPAVGNGPGAGLIAGGIGGGVAVLLVGVRGGAAGPRRRRGGSGWRRGGRPRRVLGAWSEVLDALVRAGAPAPPHLAAIEVAGHADEVARNVPGRRHARRPR